MRQARSRRKRRTKNLQKSLLRQTPRCRRRLITEKTLGDKSGDVGSKCGLFRLARLGPQSDKPVYQAESSIKSRRICLETDDSNHVAENNVAMSAHLYDQLLRLQEETAQRSNC